MMNKDVFRTKVESTRWRKKHEYVPGADPDVGPEVRMFGVLMCGGGLCGQHCAIARSSPTRTALSVRCPRGCVGRAWRRGGPEDRCRRHVWRRARPWDSEAWSEWCRLSVHSAVTDGDVGWLFASPVAPAHTSPTGSPRQDGLPCPLGAEVIAEGDAMCCVDR